MHAKSSGFRPAKGRAAATVLLLCASLLGGPVARAQKQPPIFKGDGGRTSATNMTYVHQLEADYISHEPANDEAAKLIRNRLIYVGVEQIDTYFNDYRRKSRKRNELLQFLFDFLEIGASTAIAITNGERAKEVIAEALTGFKGGRTSFTKTFRLLETQILFNKMVANRSQRLSAIYEKLNEDVRAYPWERARSDLKNYLYAGTIDDALNSLSIDTGADAQDAEEELAAIKERAGVVGAPTEGQRVESRNNFGKIRDILRVGVVADRALTAERQKPAANQDSAKIAQLEATKKGVLDDLGALFDVIEADDKLKPLLDRIPEEFSKDNPALRPRFEAALGRLRGGDATLDDYSDILPRLSNLVADELPKDPTLGGRLNTILAASTTLKAPANPTPPAPAPSPSPAPSPAPSPSPSPSPTL